LKKESQLRSALSDIINGFCFYEEEGFYLKHLTLEDYVDYELKYDNFYETLRKKKVLNNKELIEQAVKRDLWSKNDDFRIQDLEEIIQTSKENSQKLILEAQRKSQDDYVKELQEELNLLINKKNSFLAHSCESMANKKMNEYYLLKSLYKDKKFEESLFTNEEKNDISLDVTKYQLISNNCYKNITTENIKYIAIAEFFTMGWRICNNAHEYFGKPICRLSFHQSNLAFYAKIFSNIHERYPNIKSEKPDEIMRLANSRAELESSSNGKDLDVVGMTHEEADKMGIKLKDRSRQFAQASGK
jgi:hypothetical protein